MERGDDLPCASYNADMLVSSDALLAVDRDGNHRARWEQRILDEEGKMMRRLKGSGKKDQQLQGEGHFLRDWRPSLAPQLRRAIRDQNKYINNLNVLGNCSPLSSRQLSFKFFKIGR